MCLFSTVLFFHSCNALLLCSNRVAKLTRLSDRTIRGGEPLQVAILHHLIYILKQQQQLVVG